MSRSPVCLAAMWIVLGSSLVGQAREISLPHLAYPPEDLTPVEVKPRQWPGAHGGMHLCLWGDDKLAAVTFGIDDNIVPDHDWWLKMGEKYDFVPTWFVIVYPLIFNYDGSSGHQGFFGTLDNFRTLYESGHEVQEHGTTGINRFEEEAYEKDLRMTQQVLQRIDGNRASVYAYPGGASGEFRRDVAAKYFIGARGVGGGFNAINNTDYFDLRVSKVSDGSLAMLVDDPDSRYYRGWLCTFTHLIGTAKDPVAKKTQYDLVEAQIRRAHERRDDVWLTTYREALLYAQERDTATLAPGEVTEREMRFTLTDRMDDEVFDYPLTVKVRVQDDWDAVRASQAGEGVEAQFVYHEGGKYLLVDATPDRGEVVLQRVPPDASLPPALLTEPGVYRDQVSIRLANLTSDATIRYTVDGREPTEESPLYDGPILVDKDIDFLLRARAFRDGIEPSDVVQARYEVRVDGAPPRLVAADRIEGHGVAALTFSEPISFKHPDQPATHFLYGDQTVESARIVGGGRTVLLGVPPDSGKAVLRIRGLTDHSNNLLQEDLRPITLDPLPPSNEKGLVGHWRFDEMEGAKYALDATNRLPPGVINGNVKRETSGGMPTITFDGKSSLTIQDPVAPMKEANAFTVATWIRFDGPVAGTIVRTGPYSVPFSLSGVRARGVLEAYIRAGGNLKRTLTDKIEPNSWMHVAITAGDGKIVIYMDGRPTVESTQRVEVQSQNRALSVGNGFTGALADLRLYDRALTAEEVAELAEDKP